MRSELEMILSEKIALVTMSSDSPLSLSWSLEIVTCMNIVVKTEFMELCVYVYICMYVCLNICVSMHICIYVFNCMYFECMYMCACINVYICIPALGLRFCL